jgi:hypothetical protein
MKKALPITVAFLLLIPTLAFAHAGEVHSYRGTVATLHEGGSFTLQETGGQTIEVHVNATTTWLYADGRAAGPADLKAGNRVVVRMSKDGKTATSVKMAAAGK